MLNNKDYIKALNQGVSSPLLQRLQASGRGSSLFSNQDDELSKVNTQIGNYQTRLSSVGADVPEPEKKTNLFIRALQWLDKPRNAVWNAVQDVVTGENGFFQGLKEGWTGQERYEGKDLMEDLFGTAQTGGGKFAQGLGGFAAEAVLDPLNLITLGAGSLAKGFVTGTGKTITKEGAEAIAKAGLRKATQESAESTVKALAKNAGINYSDEMTARIARRLAKNRTDDALKAVGSSLEEVTQRLGRVPQNEALEKALKNLAGGADDTVKRAGQAQAKEYMDKLAQIARGEYANKVTQADKIIDSTGKGLSIAGKTINNLTNARLQDIGAEASRWVRDNTGVIGRGFGAFQDGLNKVFNPSYIAGLDGTTQKVLRMFKDQSLGQRNVADQQIKATAKRFSDALTNLGIEEGRKQDELIMRFVEGLASEKDVADVAKIIAKEMQDDFKSWGVTELNEGVLKSLIDEKYFPHVQNWGNDKLRRQMQLGGMTEKIKIVNPSSFRRKYPDIDSANLAMLIRTSSGEAVEKFNEKLLSTSTKEAVEAFNKGGGYKVLDGIRDTDLLDGITDFFETSALKSYITRGLRHNKVIADKEFVDMVTSAFGERVITDRQIKEALEAGKDVIVSKSSFKAFRVNKVTDYVGLKDVDNQIKTLMKQLKEQGVEGSEALVEAITKLDGQAGATLKRIFGDAGELVNVDAKDYAILAKYFPLEAYSMPKGVVAKMNESIRKQTDAGLQTLGGLIDSFNRAWKPTVTGLRPSYHVRNTIGSTTQNIMDIGMRTFDPQINSLANKIASGKNLDEIVELGGTKFTLKELKEGMIRTHANATFMSSEIGTLTEQLNSEIIGKLNRESLGSKVIKTPNRIGKAVGQGIEDRVRGVNFIANLESALEKGLTKQQAIQYAGDMVKQFHFDYSDLTKVEREVIRRLVPFYTWARKNIPLQLENFFNNPAFYHKAESLVRNLNSASGVDTSDMPAWFKEAMPLALPFIDAGQGKTAYANVSLPIADLGTITDPKQLLGMLTPLLKVPFETVFNRQMLTGAPISQYEGQTRDFLGVNMNNYLAHALEQFGVTRDINRLATPQSTEGKAVAPIEGLGLVQTLRAYDPYEAHVDAQYAYNRQLGNEVQKIRDQGKYVPTIDELERIARDYPQYAYLLQQGIIPPILLKSRR